MICYTIVVTHALVFCLICTPSSLAADRGIWVYISGRTLVPMLQLLNVAFLPMVHLKCTMDSHGTFNSCDTDTSVLPDMYTLIPRAAGPRDEGVHIRQNTSARVTTIM